MAHTTRGLARTGLVAGMAFAFVPMIGISPAQACSCVPSDERAQFRRADAVFKGTLPPGTRTGRGDSDTVTLTFDATRAYKGTVVAEQRVKTSGSGASCGLELSGAGPWLVFATVPRDHDGTPEAVDPDDPLYEANLCGGTRAIAAGEHPAFGEGTPVERPAPDEPSGEPGGEDRGGSAYGVFGAVLAAMLAVLGGILGWGSRS